MGGESTVLRSGDVFAGYTIKRVLGQGGMGTVYLAQHPRLPRLTALKLLKRELYTDAEIRQRFEREADLVAQLDHPNIVTVFDRGAEDQQLWISMQFVPGADASCADVNVLALGRAVQIIADTAAALDFAHANGVLHRDVKPANILLAKAPIGQPERVLLTDFGIAGMRDSDSTLGSAGTITATLAYAAPEQLTGTPDYLADQYSLACSLFWMLTGTAPFNGPNPMAVINGHLYGSIPSLRRHRPDVPPGLDTVLARAMAKRPADRFGSCTEFAVAARRVLVSSTPHPPQANGSTQHGRPGPHRPPVGPSHEPPHNAGPPRNAVPPNAAERAGRGRTTRPTEPTNRGEPPQSTESPRSTQPAGSRMPLLPRRPVRPGTIALPDIPRRPGRTPPGPAARPPP
ncbi:protein kinase [Nocardia sp. NBC_00565]|uniref:serine/threonine-protein kinase n=1 Tax=Nocardia sp. NBC_00565 TaxID=2975993 RepID=UPI002E816569|nr:protein kinase [Nocardia sp. NBC_00565]WUC00633.1 protein kinase [Nocardia sp. NBC_00565]